MGRFGLGAALLVGVALGLGAASCGGEETPDGGACVPEVCNFVDDDCDGQIDEGLAVSVACDGPDSDLCKEGQTTCAPDGGIACSDLTGGSVELCNQSDDDCDGQADEDYPGLGDRCDGPDSDLCAEGFIVCAPNQLASTCDEVAVDNPELCNAIDDDCDGATDEDFELGQPCDGADADGCREGVWICDGVNARKCTDTTVDNVELCNGTIDDDCDGETDEGFTKGPCDGADTDACFEGSWGCSADGTQPVCGDTTDDSVERCDGVDNDCDGVTDNGFNIDAACDGDDTDLCREGKIVCASETSSRCNDNVGELFNPADNDVEVCGFVGDPRLDEDCDGQTDEGNVCCGPSSPQGSICSSEIGETCSTCASDCFNVCPDGCCNGTETRTTCPQDCP